MPRRPERRHVLVLGPPQAVLAPTCEERHASQIRYLRFRGGLVFKAHRRLYHSRVIKKKRRSAARPYLPPLAKSSRGSISATQRLLSNALLSSLAMSERYTLKPSKYIHLGRLITLPP